MGTYDAFADAPNQIIQEGREITVTLDRTSATTGRVSWNIPPPALGCTSENQAYCGIVITIDTVGADRDTPCPTDGTQYTADPTADRDLHAGDVIGTALVIGAFYEGVEKGTGQDFTTTLDITGMEEGTAYFVNAYAVDCQNRYHCEGVYAYSLDKCLQSTPDTAGTVTVTWKDAFEPTDGTGLTVGNDYSMLMEIDGTEYTIVVNGSDAQTYADMVEAINIQLEQLTTAPQSTVPPNTNACYYNTTSGKLFQWDGYEHNEIPVLNEPTDPTALAVGNYWYDNDDDILYRWNGATWDVIPESQILRYSKDPRTTSNLTSDDYWYRTGSPTAAYHWHGNVWCEDTLYDQTTDPSQGITAEGGYYWYNPTDLLLRQWNEQTCSWQEIEALYWSEDPTNLSANTHWFDDINNELWLINSGSPRVGTWNPLGRSYIDFTLSVPHSSSDVGLVDGEYTETITVAGQVIEVTVNVCDATAGRFDKVFEDINSQLGEYASIAFVGTEPTTVIRLTSANESAPVITAGGTLFTSLTDYASTEPTVVGDLLTVGTEPTSPIANQYWVNDDGEVFRRNGANTAWVSQCAIVYGVDPTDVTSCDTWWNSDTDILNVWDAVAGAWTPVVSFTQSALDPTAAVALPAGVVWYSSATEVMNVWDGTKWAEVTYVASPTDPTVPATGTIWYNPTTGEWSELDATPAWVEFNPVDSPDDPSQATLPSGTFWYDTINMTLSMWNGTNWVGVAFSTTPLTPDTGDLWYDLSTNTLMEWDGTTWVEASAIASAMIASSTEIIFTSGSTGNDSLIDLAKNSTDNELIYAFDPVPSIQCPLAGTDGLSCLPTYEQEGIGTDGSQDERREMMNEILFQLGYPTVEVELTKNQMNKAVDIALKELRRHSGSGYHRGFMKLYVAAGKQIYKLTKPDVESDNEGTGFELADGQYGHDKIVQVMGCFRVTSAFMTGAHGSGVFGQVVLQHLYNMGTFDLLSFHLVSEYIEQLEHLFASRLGFHWNESARSLTLHQSFAHGEQILMDVAVERTEQELFTDRFTGRWLERWAISECKKMLAQIRGKYGSLPGAGGGVSLNASDLAQEARDEQEMLLKEIEDYVTNNAEEYGMHAEFIIG